MATQPILRTGRVPLRLRMSPRAGHGRLDGAWWPQSRDLAVELADLVDHFPVASGRIMRVHCFPPDWDSHPVRLTTSDHSVLYLLVVPPGTPEAPAQAALLTAAAQGSAAGAEHLLSVAAAWSAEDGDADERGTATATPEAPPSVTSWTW